VQGRSRQGKQDLRAALGPPGEAWVKGKLCAEADGFSLHAGSVVLEWDRPGLERLCRYAGRPALAESRLSRLPDGRLCYELKRAWQDGTSHVVLEPEVLIERLMALVPRPRKHLVTYHGVLAPGAGLRSLVVREGAGGRRSTRCRHGAGGAGGAGEAGEAEERGDEAATCRALPQRVVPHAPGERRWGGRRRYAWAELLKRVFLVDVLVCPRCGGPRTVLAAIHDPFSIRRVLEALGLSAEAPEMAPARGPPDGSCDG